MSPVPTSAPALAERRRSVAERPRQPWTDRLIIGAWRSVSTRVDRDIALALGVMSWITIVLLLDADGGRTLQRSLGVITASVLVVLLAREQPLVRVQTGVVVVFATAIEYTFSPLLEVYVYRFHNVPLYVPPGHGLVYLAALALGRSRLMRTHRRAGVLLTVGVGGAWAIWGLAFAHQRDLLGAFWFLCLVGFLLWGRSRLLYVGAFVVVSYLELVGTSLQTWVWQPVDPTGLVPIGNPPSGAAGGYGWFDLAAIVLAPRLLLRWTRRSWPRRSAPPAPPASASQRALTGS